MGDFLLFRLSKIIFLAEYAKSDSEVGPWLIGFMVVLFVATGLVRYFSSRNK